MITKEQRKALHDAMCKYSGSKEENDKKCELLELFRECAIVVDDGIPYNEHPQA